MADLIPVPLVDCLTVRSGHFLDLLRDDSAFSFYDAVDQLAERLGAPVGLVPAAFSLRMLDTIARMSQQPTSKSRTGTRHRAHEMGLPVVGGGL